MIDPQSRNVTSFFMVLAIIVLAALAWSVGRDSRNDATADAQDGIEATGQPACPDEEDVGPGAEEPACTPAAAEARD